MKFIRLTATGKAGPVWSVNVDHIIRYAQFSGATEVVITERWQGGNTRLTVSETPAEIDALIEGRS